MDKENGMSAKIKGGTKDLISNIPE